ncbi:MAG: hypothetical protein ACOCXG_04040 [Nanoarchaeota archaeon]
MVYMIPDVKHKEVMDGFSDLHSELYYLRVLGDSQKKKFLGLLAQDLFEQAENDSGNNRPRLSSILFDTSSWVNSAVAEMEEVEEKSFSHNFYSSPEGFVRAFGNQLYTTVLIGLGAISTSLPRNGIGLSKYFLGNAKASLSEACDLCSRKTKVYLGSERDTI